VLHDVKPNVGDPLDFGALPQAPWCAARLETGLALYPGAAVWLGDYERLVAWAWIERPKG